LKTLELEIDYVEVKLMNKFLLGCPSLEVLEAYIPQEDYFAKLHKSPKTKILKININTGDICEFMEIKCFYYSHNPSMNNSLFRLFYVLSGLKYLTLSCSTTKVNS
jgi:hypothetical protein